MNGLCNTCAPSESAKHTNSIPIGSQLPCCASAHAAELAPLQGCSKLVWVRFVYSVQAFQLALFVSVSLGVLITYAIALCATVNSPMATTVTGNAKDIVCTACGWAIFGGFDRSIRNVAGLTLSFAGAGLFSWIKLQVALRTSGSGTTIQCPSANVGVEKL
jgi:hypothetical protein